MWIPPSRDNPVFLKNLGLADAAVGSISHPTRNSAGQVRWCQHAANRKKGPRPRCGTYGGHSSAVTAPTCTCRRKCLCHSSQHRPLSSKTAKVQTPEMNSTRNASRIFYCTFFHFPFCNLKSLKDIPACHS